MDGHLTSTAAADWSALPASILESILISLTPSYAICVRFGAVCTWWHTVAVEYSKRCTSCFLPYRLRISDYWSNNKKKKMMKKKRSIHCPLERRSYSLPSTIPPSPTSPRSLDGWHVFGSSNGWLALADSTTAVMLLNPFSGARYDLPPLRTLPGLQDVANDAESFESFVDEFFVDFKERNNNINNNDDDKVVEGNEAAEQIDDNEDFDEDIEADEDEDEIEVEEEEEEEEEDVEVEHNKAGEDDKIYDEKWEEGEEEDENKAYAAETITWFADKIAVAPSTMTVMIIFYSKKGLAFSRPGDKEWTVVKTFKSWTGPHFTDIMYRISDGRFYAVTSYMTIYAIYPSVRGIIKLPQQIPGDFSFDGFFDYKGHLVCLSSGELLCVLRQFFMDTTETFEVYKLTENRWVEVKSLKDWVVLVGQNSSISLSSSSPAVVAAGLRGNCIYMVNESSDEMLRILNVKDKNIKMFKAKEDLATCLWIQPSFDVTPSTRKRPRSEKIKSAGCRG